MTSARSRPSFLSPLRNARTISASLQPPSPVTVSDVRFAARATPMRQSRNSRPPLSGPSTSPCGSAAWQDPQTATLRTMDSPRAAEATAGLGMRPEVGPGSDRRRCANTGQSDAMRCHQETARSERTPSAVRPRPPSRNESAEGSRIDETTPRPIVAHPSILSLPTDTRSIAARLPYPYSSQSGPGAEMP